MSDLKQTLVWPLAALAVLLAFNAVFNPTFYAVSVVDGHLVGSMIDVLDRAAPVLLLAIGMTLVIATSGIDLSVGAVMAMAGSMVALFLSQMGLPLIPSIGITLVLCAVAGVWNGLLVSYAGIQPIVATLILMVAGRGIAQLLTDGQIVSVSEHTSFALIGNGYIAGMPVSIIIVAIMILATAILTRRTALGLFIESIGGNETASRYAGINVRLVRVLVYSFCGLCAGVAGLIYTSDITAADANNAGLYLELDAILAVVIGGTALTGGRFFIIGSVVGALIIQTMSTTVLMTTIGEQDVPPEYNLVAKALIVLIVCLLQSDRFRALIAARRVAA